jgi:hypothetical protein
MTKDLFKRALLLTVLLNLSFLAFPQMAESQTIPTHFNGAVTVTNNGISFIPTFSLGKPAVIFDLSVGKKLSFDPQLRFALEGKPWSFLFWWRYKFINNEKFFFSVGAHPALSFKNLTIPTETGTREILTVHRYVAGEISPNYRVAKDISVGFYYLFSHCFDKEGTNFTNFLTFNANFSGINLTKQYFLRFNPQIYYLKMDKDDGFYFSSSLTIARRNFPISISALVNKTIQTDISASRDFVWNASLIYTFNNKYTRTL